jgi:rod shape-determining protein MreC
MALSKRDGRAAIGTVQHWRATAQRLSSLLLAMTAIALMVMGKLDVSLTERVRTRAGDIIAPLLAFVSQPIVKVNSWLAEASHLVELARENMRLREENTRLRQWQDSALKLEAENASLRALLTFKPEPAVQTRTARVVGDQAGQYVRSVLVVAGSKDGIAKGQAAMAGSGLAGRVTEVGFWSSRVLLLTDLNSRVPVMLEESRDRAIVAGDNTDFPRLLYLPQDARIVPGQRVVTSGHDGVFPAGLPVGLVRSVSGGEVRIAPLADLSRLDVLQLIDTGTSALTPETAPAAPPVPPAAGGTPAHKARGRS